jgi:gamma-glutamylcyclotransferase (GGCT)/AIG2-like uncharacterized protein YtfP
MSKYAAARTAAEIEEAVDAMPAEEYASVTISIDHLVTSPHPNGHAVCKNVWSTETAVESLLAQLDYFSDSQILSSKGVLSMIAKGEEKAVIFVYTVNDRLTNIIVDAALWSETLANAELSKGTVMGAHAALMTVAADMKRAAAAEGRPSRVLAFISN